MRALMEARMLQRVRQDVASGPVGGWGLSEAASASLVRHAVAAFFHQDLLGAARQLLSGAIGSFGLVLSTSIDAQRQLVLASRGQTMSVAFYPRLGAVLFGSEAAATKAGLGAIDGRLEGSIVGKSVGTRDGSKEGCADGCSVGGDVGERVGSKVGCAEGESVGCSVGSAVGSLVGKGEIVGAGVG